MSSKRTKQTSLLHEGHEGEEHRRLALELRKYAKKHGFLYEFSFKNEMQPDVLLRDGLNHLFLGDAKDSANERPSKTATSNRILGYIETYLECVESGRVRFGDVAICTNCFDAANEWRVWLNDVFNQYGLDSADFKIAELAQDTFIIAL
ncbi:MAG: hypothetical protein ACOYIS_03930 [Candidatus Cloacimonadaceae bacterium]|jgi:hypothetical protein